MLGVIRRKLAMLVRTRDFVQANPLTDTTYVTGVARLNALLSRAEALARQELAGREREKAIVGHRNQVRYRLHREPLLDLVRIAYLASIERPELAGEFRRPNSHAPLNVFISTARRLLEAGQKDFELLARYGLRQACLEEIGTLVAEFDEMSRLVLEAQRLHIRAHAELMVSVEEGLQQVAELDPLVRAHFRNSAEQLGAWEQASMEVPFRAPEENQTPCETAAVITADPTTTTPPTQETVAA